MELFVDKYQVRGNGGGGGDGGGCGGGVGDDVYKVESRPHLGKTHHRN